MSSRRLRLQVVISAAGILALLATFALAIGSMRDTEATWNDKVVGQAQFGMKNPYENNRFARAISTYGVMDRAVRSSNIGAVTAFRQTPDVSRQIVGPTSSNSVGYFPTFLLPLETEGLSCSTLDPQSKCDNGNPANLANPTASAVSETRSLEVRSASILGSDLVTYQGTNPIRATAACSPADGAATLNSDGPIVLGRTGLFEQEVRVALPAANSETSGTRTSGSYTYNATLQHVKKESRGYALSQLRLRVNATGTGGAERWNLTMILAHAECGVDQQTTTAPDRPTTGEWPAISGRSSRTAVAQLDQPAALQSIVELQTALADDAEPTMTEESEDEVLPSGDEPMLPSLPADEIGEETGEETADPRTEVTAPATSLPAASVPAAAGTETETGTGTGTAASTESNPATSTAPAAEDTTEPKSAATANSAPEPTEQAAVAEGPQQPESVRVGREFAVGNRDGVELGTAKVEDITRSAGCGVELTLGITTTAEAGPDRWASIGPSDFADVRSGGTTREADRTSSDCEQASSSRSTALSPGRDYEIVIAFQLDDSAQRAMLRPDGTAGWIFDLPPLAGFATTTTPSSAPAPSPAATTSAASQTSAAKPAEA